MLEVEKNGEAWYIDPLSLKRYFLGRPKDAFNIMKKLGLDINASDINSLTGKVAIDYFEGNQKIINVPFTTQALFAEWDDKRHQDGCEEASLAMVWY